MKHSNRQGLNIDGGVNGRDNDARFRRFAVIITIPFLLLGFRLWFLQIWEGDTYTQKAFSNVIDRTAVPAKRGLILDSKGNIIAENRPSYDVVLKPIYFAPSKIEEAELNKRIKDLQRYLSLTAEDTRKLTLRIEKTQGLLRHKPLLVKKRVTRDQVAVVLSNVLELPGVEVLAVSQRHYPYDDLAAHIIGYMGEINAKEFKKFKDLGFHLGEMIGRTGLESAFDPVLRGAPGLKANVVNSRRVPQYDSGSMQLLGDWKDIEAIPGKNVILTIDMDLQRIVKDAMRKYSSGGVVALDPRTGRILAMVSKPSFNPNSWSGQLTFDEFREQTTDLYKPLIDKSVSAYFPGSTYKIVTALAALDTGLVKPTESFECPGYYEFGRNRKRFGCWKQSGHGKVSLAEAIKGSCDVYFYKIGEQIGMNRLADYAKLLGFGSKSGIGLSAEKPGLVPTKEYHKKRAGGLWQAGYTLSTSIGQGDTRVSPLQLALAFATIANGGTLYYPSLVDRIETAKGQVLFQYPNRIRHKLNIKPEHLHEITRGLDMVINDDTGTAHKHQLDYIRVAGKTGTAQVTSKRVNNKTAEWKKRDHAWFAAFAPVQDPQFVVVVFLEHGGGGSTNAAPVAMEIIDRYFREIQHHNPLLVEPERARPLFLEPPKLPGNRKNHGNTLIGEPGSRGRWNPR